MQNNLLTKINHGDFKYLVASLVLIVFLLGVIGYALFFLVGESWRIVGSSKKNIPVDSTKFDSVKLQQLKKSFPLFGT